jgi:hypothetical protein
MQALPELIITCTFGNTRMLPTAGKCAITFNTDQFRHSNLSSCSMEGRLGTALPPGASVVLDRASDTLVPCTPDLCPYAIPSARDSSVLVNFVPMSIPVVLAYIASPTLVIDTSPALGAFASHNTVLFRDYLQAYKAAMQPGAAAASVQAFGVTDDEIAAAIGAVSNRNTAIAHPSVTVDPRPFLSLGFNLHDTVEFLQGSCLQVLCTPQTHAPFQRTCCRMRLTCVDVELTLCLLSLQCVLKSWLLRIGTGGCLLQEGPTTGVRLPEMCFLVHGWVRICATSQNLLRLVTGHKVPSPTRLPLRHKATKCAIGAASWPRATSTAGL